MASNYDNLTFEGNLGSDATMAFAPDGSPYTRFSVCCNREYTNRKAETVSEKKWYACVVFGEGRAQFANKFEKGDRIAVFEGQLEADPATGGPRIWYGQDGTPHASFNVIVHQMRWYPKGDKGKDAVEKEPEGLIENGQPAQSLPDQPLPNYTVPAASSAAAPADDPLADYQPA